MTENTTTALLAYIRQHQLAIHADFQRTVLRLTLQALMEWEVSAAIRAGHYERIGSRKTYRNGYRERLFQSESGEITLHIPKLRQGTYHPRFLRDAEPLILDWSQQVFLRRASVSDIQAIQQQVQLESAAPDEYERLIVQLDRLREKTQRFSPDTAYHALELNQVTVNARHQVHMLTGYRHDGIREVIAIDSGYHAFSDDSVTGLTRRVILSATLSQTTYQGFPSLSTGAESSYLVDRPADKNAMLRLLTQLRNLHQSEIVVAVSDLALLPEDEVCDFAA